MSNSTNNQDLTFETASLRNELKRFLDTAWTDPSSGIVLPIGNFKFGVYAFFDFDSEPIYVGQTNEKVRTRIRRHLTNQRTDAVAMSVLDPFEVFEVEVWPLPQFQMAGTGDTEAKRHLDSLEATIYENAIQASKFGAVLNEKLPPQATVSVEPPESFRARIVSEEVFKIRSHPDYRILRRSQVIARLAQVIAERKVQPGLRRTLHVQAQRLEWLASSRSTS